MSSRTDLRVSSPAEDPLPPEAVESGTTATRTLAACVHLSDRFGDVIREHFRIQPYRAMAPSYSVDAITVVGHARFAQRHQLTRNLVLLGLLAGMVVIVGRTVPTGQRLSVAAASGAVLVAGWLFSRWLRHHLEQRTTMAALKVYYSSHRRAAVEHLIVVLAAAATVLILALTTADLASETLLMTILLAIAWLVVAAERYLSLYLAGLVTTARRPARSGAVELSARLRADHARIQSVERNLIVYNSTANFHDTFVGCGEPIDPHDINIDASIGRHDKDGKRLIPQKVDVGELHSVLLTAVLDLGAPGCWGGYRTYIDGRSIGDAPWTGDGPFDPLDVNIDDQLVRPGPRTERSPGRTYLCIQITTWDGDLVVTLFVRATLVGANLHLRQKVYVLAPLSLEFQETVRTLPRYTLRRLAVAAGYATRNTIPHLLSSPWRCAEVPARILGRDVRQVWDWWQISHGEDYDHGAAYSAREVFANTAMIHADAWDDVVQQVHLLQTGYTSALHHYLEGRDIDTSSLNETLKSFHLHQATSFTIDKVHNLSTGAHSKAGDETYFNPSPPDRPTPTTGSSGPSGSSGSES